MRVIVFSVLLVPAVMCWSLRFPRQNAPQAENQNTQNPSNQDQLLAMPVADAPQAAQASVSAGPASQEPAIMNEIEGSGVSDSMQEPINTVVYGPVQNERPLQPPAEGSGSEIQEGSGNIEGPTKLMDQPNQQAVQSDVVVSTTISAAVFPSLPTSDSLLTNNDSQVEGSGTNEEGQKLLFDQSEAPVEESQKTVYQYLNVDALNPEAENVIFNITLPTKPQQLLDRILISARKYSYQEKLDLALRLTEANHRLMTSIDDDLDMIR